MRRRRIEERKRMKGYKEEKGVKIMNLKGKEWKGNAPQE